MKSPLPSKPHLLHCEKCLQTIRTLSPDDALISSLQQGRDFATQAPRNELLEKLRVRLQEMPASARGADTATGENTYPNAPAPSAEMMGYDSVSLRPPQQPDEIGGLGGYRVLKELGRGGMGAVFQAEDPKLKRLVALKVMLPRLAADAAARRRFLREAQAMAAVHHDHIVTIYQVDEADAVPFLAMEFLHGMPLDKWLNDGSKPNLAQILRMGSEIAEGLAAAHERGLIHRDIKPGNIWLDSDHKGRVKILDFGLARVGTDDVHLTHSGAIVGTPAYMSPEQGAGQKVDARTDLFSLGCILYRFCTGAMPFNGDTTMALLTALALTDPKPVRELNPETPPELADLVMRLLAKKPADRPTSAQEVVEQIEAISRAPVERAAGFIAAVETKPAGINPATRIENAAGGKKRRSWVFATVAAAAALIVAAGAVIYVQTDRGTLEIKTSDPGVKVSVEQNGAEVNVFDPQSKQQLSIHSGIYTLKLTGVDGADHEMIIDQGKGTNPVTLTRGGKVVVEVRRVGKSALAKVDIVQPRVDYVQPKVDYVQPRVDYVQPRVQIVQPRIQVVQPRIEKVEPRIQAVEGTTKSTFPALDEAWAKKVRNLPAEKQVEEVAAELKRRNSGFDGKMTPRIENSMVTGLAFVVDEVTDISPVKALTKLRSLTCVRGQAVDAPLADLSALKGMKLEALNCSGTPVSDLSPLKGMKLEVPDCWCTLVSDLAPLQDMKLTGLNCHTTKVSDLTPLKGMPLTFFACQDTQVSDLSPLKDMKLTYLDCCRAKVSRSVGAEGACPSRISIATSSRSATPTSCAPSRRWRRSTTSRRPSSGRTGRPSRRRKKH